MTNSVFILGSGRMGSVAARDLLRSNVVDRILIGDLDIGRAEKLAKELGSRKVAVTQVDASRESDIVRAITGCTVIINAVWYELNPVVMRAAIKARVHYNDLGGLFHVTRKQMELNDEAKKAGITAVLGGGESPGISNVMVAASAQNLDTVEEIRVRAGGREETQSGDRLVFPFAVSTVFDEYSKPPIMFLKGKFEDVPALSGEEEVDFPEPVGRNLCHYTIHSEMASLPFSFKGVRTVDFKLGVSEKIFKAVKPLLEAGLSDTVPINVKGRMIAPRDFAIGYLTSRSSDEEPKRYVALKTEVLGTQRGERVVELRHVIGEPSDSFQVKNATGLLTGISASIIVQFIINGQTWLRGAVAPEVCVPPVDFFDELKKRGVRVDEPVLRPV
jgi:saccharopine dehydrogenase-like NADP-dependent oxidoreductase